jgi:hypothetical protein
MLSSAPHRRLRSGARTFCAFFNVYLWGAWFEVISYTAWRSQKMREKSVFTGSMALRRPNCSPAWARCDHEFTLRRWRLTCRSVAVYGRIKKIFKVLAALSLSLIYALVTLAIYSLFSWRCFFKAYRNRSSCYPTRCARGTSQSAYLLLINKCL